LLLTTTVTDHAFSNISRPIMLAWHRGRYIPSAISASSIACHPTTARNRVANSRLCPPPTSYHTLLGSVPLCDCQWDVAVQQSLQSRTRLYRDILPAASLRQPCRRGGDAHPHRPVYHFHLVEMTFTRL